MAETNNSSSSFCYLMIFNSRGIDGWYESFLDKLEELGLNQEDDLEFYDNSESNFHFEIMCTKDQFEKLKEFDGFVEGELTSCVI